MPFVPVEETPAAPAPTGGRFMPVEDDLAPLAPGESLASRIPGASQPAPAATRHAAPQRKYGVMDQLQGAFQAAREIVNQMVGGTAGQAVGLVEGIGRYAATGKDQVQETMARRGEQGAALVRGREVPGELGQRYADTAMEKLGELGPAMAAGPMGAVGIGRHSKAMGAGTPLRAAAEGIERDSGGFGLVRKTPEQVDAIQTQRAARTEARDAVKAETQAARKASLEARPTPERVQQAREAGFVTTGSAGTGGKTARAVEGVAGQKELNRDFSAHNQENANVLGRRDMGLPDDAPLTADTIMGQIKAEGEKYRAVSDIGEFQHDAEFRADLKRAFDDADKATASYPELKSVEDSVKANVQALDVPNATTKSTVAAVKRLRVLADTEYRQGRPESGRAYRHAAQALDDSMGRALDRLAQTTADPELAMRVNEYQAARTRIAKLYTGLKAVDAHGNLDMAVYGKEVKKNPGKVTGPGREIGDFYNAFGERGLAQRPKGESSVSAGDVLLGAVRAVGKNPVRAAAEVVGARPGARKALLGLEKRRVATAQAEKRIREQVAAEPPQPAEPLLTPGAGPDGGAPAPNTPGPNSGRVLKAPEREFPMSLAPDGAAPVEGLDAQALYPAVGDNPPPARVNPAPRPNRAEQIPAVPGRPDLPDTLIVGEPQEAAGSARANAEMLSPGAVAAREAQNPGAQTVRDAHAANATTEIEIAQRLRAKANETKDEGLARALRARADKLDPPNAVPAGEATEIPMEAAGPKAEKTGKVPAGKATEVPMAEAGPKGEKAPSKIPAGKAEELPVESVEPAPEPMELPEVTYLDDDAWRAAHKLGAADARRAVNTRKAMEIDSEAVEAAAKRYDNNPTKFDTVIQHILDRKEKPRAADQVSQQGRVQAEPEGRSEGRQATETGPGDRLQRAEEGGREAAKPEAAEMTAAEWAAEMARLRKERPRSVKQLFGAKGPTPEQAAAHAAKEREWNAAYRRASKTQKTTLDRENAARRKASED